MVVPTAAWLIISAGVSISLILVSIKLATALVPVGWALLICAFVLLTALLVGQHQKFIDFADWIRRIIRERKERRYSEHGPTE